MVIGNERTNWHEGHGSACTCAACATRAADQRRFDDATQGRKVGRNEKCPCGAGEVYTNYKSTKRFPCRNEDQQSCLVKATLGTPRP